MWWNSSALQTLVLLLSLAGVLGQATVTHAQDSSQPKAAEPAGDSPEVKAARKLLEGRWISIRHRRDGMPVEQETKIRLEFWEDHFDLNDGTTRLNGQYRLDLSATPKRITLATRGGELFASYAIEKGELKLCFGAGPNVKAPGAVETARGDGRLLTVFAPQLVRILEGHRGPVRTAAFSPDGKMIASGSSCPKGDRTIRVWDVESGKEIQRIDVLSFVSDEVDYGPNRRVGDVEQLAFAPAGREIVACGTGGFLLMWNVDTGRLTRRFEGAGPLVHSMAISADGRFVLASGRKKNIVVWDLASGKRLREIGMHDRQIRSLAVSPDGQYVVSSGRDNTVRLWDLKSGEELHRFELDGMAISVSFSPDGRQAMAAIGGQATAGPVSPISIWNVETGEVVRRIEAHRAGVTGAVFSPDGRRILSCGYDHYVCLWDMPSGTLLERFRSHRNWIASVAFSPDGRFALSAGGGSGSAKKMEPGEDFGIRLWNLAIADDEDAKADD